jgi:hypothetical protein
MRLLRSSRPFRFLMPRKSLNMYQKGIKKPKMLKRKF